MSQIANTFLILKNKLHALTLKCEGNLFKNEQLLVIEILFIIIIIYYYYYYY